VERSLPRAQAEVRGVDDPAIGHDQGALEHVPQLTHIAWPFVTE
jgi:hypothetical protein